MNAVELALSVSVVMAAEGATVLYVPRQMSEGETSTGPLCEHMVASAL